MSFEVRMIKINVHFYVVFFLITFIIAIPSYADKLNVAYGGVFTAGAENNYPNYLKIKKKFNTNVKIANILRKLKVEGKLNFNLLLETDAEELKFDANSPCTLALVITRDDCISEKFEVNDIIVYKNIINIGLSAIFYQTDEISKVDRKENRHSILFSVPITGYILNLEGNEQIGEDKMLELFQETLIKIIEEKLPLRLSKVAFGKIEGKILEKNNDRLKIDLGSRNGLLENQFVTIFSNNRKIARAQVVELGQEESFIKLSNSEIKLSDDVKIVAVNIRGSSEENYQIVDFKIISKRAKDFFKQEEIGPQITQWLTDYLFYNGGKTMMPPRVGCDWISESTENAFMILVKDGISYTFELSKPKYEVAIELTGLTCKETESNSINTEKIYKIWVKLRVPKKSFEQEYELADAKIIINNVQKYQDKDIFFEMLNKIAVKIAEQSKRF